LILLGFLFANQNYLQHVQPEYGACAAKTGSCAGCWSRYPKNVWQK